VSASEPPSVDVLIVSHNTRELLEACLDSIERHRPPEQRIKLRVKVFDNCSSDGTAQMLQTRFPSVELTRSSTNEGFARANNRLAAASSADYLLLLNPDTVWRADIVEPLLETLRRDPRTAIVGPRLIYPDGRVQLSSQRLPSLGYELALALAGTKLARFGSLWDAGRIIAATRQLDLLEERVPRTTDFLWATCWLLARADLAGMPLFDRRFILYDEDLDLCTRLRRRGRTVVYRPDVELVHVGGASSTSSAKLALMRAARTRYYRIHRGRLVALAYRYGVPLLWRLRLSGKRRTPGAA